MNHYFEVDFEVSRDFTLDCFCAKCGYRLEVEDIDVDCGEIITAKVQPCTKCNQPAQIDNESEFFKDLLEFTEKELGQDAARRMELFVMTWHKKGRLE